jgi:hypothetical protein
MGSLPVPQWLPAEASLRRVSLPFAVEPVSAVRAAPAGLSPHWSVARSLVRQSAPRSGLQFAVVELWCARVLFRWELFASQSTVRHLFERQRGERYWTDSLAGAESAPTACRFPETAPPHAAPSQGHFGQSSPEHPPAEAAASGFPSPADSGSHFLLRVLKWTPSGQTSSAHAQFQPDSAGHLPAVG